MEIEFNKHFFSKDILQESISIWKEYFETLELLERKDFFLIHASAKNLKSLLSEFNNYVLDIASAKELGK